MTNRTKFHPILFQTEMVRAILEGRKTQTRRIIKDVLLQEKPCNVDEEFLAVTVKERYKIGDVLWVREAFHFIYDSSTDQFLGFGYRADNDWKGAVWKPSIHMPKKACRLFLEITDIRIERLQDITESDAIAEGVEETERWPEAPSKPFYKWYDHPEGLSTVDPAFSFATLWESINGELSFTKNPWVRAIIFKRIDQPENFI